MRALTTHHDRGIKMKKVLFAIVLMIALSGCNERASLILDTKFIIPTYALQTTDVFNITPASGIPGYAIYGEGQFDCQPETDGTGATILGSYVVYDFGTTNQTLEVVDPDPAIPDVKIPCDTAIYPIVNAVDVSNTPVLRNE